MRWALACSEDPAHAQRGLKCLLAAFLVKHLALDQKDLPDMREVQTRVERRAAPDTSCFYASVIRWGHLHKVRCPSRLEQPRDIGAQRKLVAFDA